MKGVALSDLKDSLFRVPKRNLKKPDRTIPDTAKKLAESGFEDLKLYMEASESPFDFFEQYPELPLEALSQFSFDEICKLKFSCGTMMEGTVEKLFYTVPHYEVMRKIRSSLWRWSLFDDDWNQIVAGYDGLRSFHIDDLGDDFDLRLDFTTGYNQRGPAKFNRICLDGVFAYLLYHKGEHVMTISFSFLEGYRLFVTQVQLAKRKGNRFLFKLPANRLEFVLQRMREAFPQHKIGVVDGGSLSDMIVADYARGLAKVSSRIKRHEAHMKVSSYDAEERARRLAEAEHNREEYRLFQECIDHLKADRRRLAAFYDSLGTFSVKGEVDAGGLRFRLVA